MVARTQKTTEQKVYDAALKKLEAATEQFQAAKQALIDSGCVHPETHRSTWDHHYSNGFGSWKTEVMPYCKVCGKVQYNSAYSYRWGPIPVNHYED